MSKYRWYARASSVIREKYQDQASGLITEAIEKMREVGLHVEHVYDPTEDTENIFLPADAAVALQEVIQDAGYIEKAPPNNESDLKERLLMGSNMNKKWH